MDEQVYWSNLKVKSNNAKKIVMKETMYEVCIKKDCPLRKVVQTLAIM